MRQGFSLFMITCFCVGLLSGFSTQTELSGDHAAQEIFSTYLPKQQRCAYRWVASGKDTYKLHYGRKTAADLVLGRVPLLVVVNFWNPVTAIDRTTLVAVLQGEITNWDALGGADCPIEVLTYDQAGLPTLPLLDRAGVRRVTNQEGMVAAVGATPGAIGIVTWPVVNPRLKVLTVDGINPAWSLDSVLLTSYPFWTELALTLPPPARVRDWLTGRFWRERRFRRKLQASFVPSKELGGKPAFTLAAVGDVMLSRNVAQTSFAHGDFCYSFLKVAPILRRATLAFANLESPLSDQGQQINMFRADPRFLAGLQYAGIDLVSLANNHIMDYGTEAFLDTMERLTAQGVFYVGAGTDLTRARQGRLFNLGGVKVGFLAYTQVGPGFTYTRVPQHWVATDELPGVVPARVDYLQEDLARLKQVADLVIVSFHWGQEYVHLPTATQQLLGRTALAAGADLVLGHHPHVIQGLAFGEEGVIAYSLGNFIFDQRPEVTRQGLVLEAAGDHRGIRQLRCTPIIIKDEQPQVAEGDDAKRLMGLVYTVSQDLPSASKLLK